MNTKIKFLALALVVCACGNTSDPSNTEVTLPEQVPHLTPVSISLETELVRPVNMLNVCDTYLITIDHRPDSIFTVLSLPDLKPLHYWGKVGNGPGEFNDIRLFTVVPAGAGRCEMEIIDNALGEITTYAVHENEIRFVNKKFGDDGLRYTMMDGFFNRLQKVKDDLYFVRYETNNGYREYAALNPAQNDTLYTVGSLPIITNVDIQDIRNEYGSIGTVNPITGQFAYFYLRKNMFRIFDPNKKTLKTIQINDPFIKSEGHEIFMFRYDATSDDHYMYAYGPNMPYLGDRDKSINMIEVWDWNGQFIKRFTIDGMLYKVVAHNKKVYSISTRDMKAIHVYDMSESMP